MLVLSRRKLESIKIGDNIEVQVISIDGNRVKLGFIAPDEVKILRTEVKPRPILGAEHIPIVQQTPNAA